MYRRGFTLHLILLVCDHFYIWLLLLVSELQKILCL